MRGLTQATLDLGLCSVSPGKAVPEWVHLLPHGFMQGRDGRNFDLADPAGLILAFQAHGADLPVDYEHQSDKPEAKLKGPVPAAGWIKELQSRVDGIWGRVEWTAMAAEMIAAREYRYISPTILYHPKTTEIVRLTGAGLVHKPNLHLTALNTQEAPMPLNPSAPDQSMFLALVAQLLGLPSDTPLEDIMARLKDRLSAQPDPAKFMPVTAVQEMLAERLNERRAVDQGRAQEKVRAAIQQRYITPGMRDWALALCQSDEASFDTFLGRVGPVFAFLGKSQGAVATAHLTQESNGPVQSELEAAMCAQLGLKPGALSN